MTDNPAMPDEPPASVEDWRALVRRFEGRGKMLRAYDAAVRAMKPPHRRLEPPGVGRK